MGFLFFRMSMGLRLAALRAAGALLLKFPKKNLVRAVPGLRIAGFSNNT